MFCNFNSFALDSSARRTELNKEREGRRGRGSILTYCHYGVVLSLHPVIAWHFSLHPVNGSWSFFVTSCELSSLAAKVLLNSLRLRLSHSISNVMQ